MFLRAFALAALLSGFGLALTAHAGPVIPPQPGCGIATSGFVVSAAGEVTAGDSNFAITAGASWAATSATLTAPRVWTVPAASAYAAGCTLTVSDAAAGVSATNTLTVQRSGSDTISGAASVVLQGAYTSVTLRSNGSTAWTILSDELTLATACPSGQFAIASNASGNSLTCAAPAFAQVTGSLGCGQMPALTGGVVGTTGSCAVTTRGYIVPGWPSFSAASQYVPGAINLGGLTQNALPTVDTQTFSQVTAPGSYTIAGLAVYLNTGQTGGAARLCVYRDTNGQPGTLLADFGTIALTGAAGIQVAAGTTLAVTPGEILWIDVATKGVATGPTVVTYAPALGLYPYTAGEIAGSANMRGLFFQVASTYPTSACTGSPPSLAENANGNTPMPWIKVQ